MAIFFDEKTQIFFLEGKGITYAIGIDPQGYAEHLYFGARIGRDDIRSANFHYAQSGSFGVTLPGKDGTVGYYTKSSELTFFGCGDYREPAVAVAYPDGSRVSELLYTGHEILPQKPAISGMPSLKGGETLVLHLADRLSHFACDLYYTVYDDCAVVARRAVYRNNGDAPMRLDRAYSFAMTLPYNDYELLTLEGAWAEERRVERTPMHHGVFSVDSKRNTSSAMLNPFLGVLEPGSDERRGNVLGVSLVYSSSFVLKVEGTGTGRTVVTGGVNDFDFAWKLEPGEAFETPEAVLAFSDTGLGGMSRAFHDAFRAYLINPRYARAPRPVVINNWEGTYFNFTTEKLEQIAEGVKGTGIDTFVLDDGWFGVRDSDATSLGDWYVYEKKVDLKQVIATVNKLGMKFGLWFEPEMVSADSELMRAHPDWAVGIPWRPRSFSRHQFILDLTRPEVRDYIADSVNKMLREYHIEYVKWDSNRNMTEPFSLGRDADRQAEFSHRYALGLYDLCERIVEANPDVFFEGCSGGGARFDPAMLYYFPQIWTSDDSDAEERTRIQYGTSILYPLSAMSCHVSAIPNHQTGRVTPFATRADIAHLGATGYELDPTTFSDEDRKAVCEQVAEYRKMERLVLDGDLYRVADPFTSNQFGFLLVSKDKSEALVTLYHRLASANGVTHPVRMDGLDPAKHYSVPELSLVLSGTTLMSLGLPPVKGKGDFKTLKYHLVAVD